MAITYLGSGVIYTDAGVTTSSQTITPFSASSGSDLLLAWGFTDRSGASTTCTGMTFNAVAMTGTTAATGPSTQTCRMFYLVGPATGSRTLSATFSSPNTYMGVLWLAYSGVDQTTPVDIATRASVSGTSGSIAAWSIAVGSGNLAVGCCVHLIAGFTVTAQNSTVIRLDGANGAKGNFGRAIAGELGTSPTASLGWTTTGTPASFGTAIEINASAGGPSGKPTMYYAQQHG
jgi:hypothetical protein